MTRPSNSFPHRSASPASMKRLLNFTITAAAVLAVFVTSQGCSSGPRKNYLHSDWSAFEALNPTDIVISRVIGEGVSKEVDLDIMRDAVRDQLLNHRYSPLAFEFTDRGSSVAPANASSATPGAAAEGNDTKTPGAVAKLKLVIKEFDFRKYEISKTIHIVGEYQFTDGSNDRMLATVVSDQHVDVSDDYRRGATMETAIRTASQRFAEISLRAMPDRHVGISQGKR
ncbi:MAG: hypothetical protein ACKVS6_14085 [Planctomycetota bacterium]